MGKKVHRDAPKMVGTLWNPTGFNTLFYSLFIYYYYLLLLYFMVFLYY